MLNSRSFNIMKALEEAETFEINKKITVDSYHESLIESAEMNEGKKLADRQKIIELIKSGALDDIETLEKEGGFNDAVDYWVEHYYDDKPENLDEDSLGNNTFTDKDEAEYYRNKELYANSGLARHREAMEKAKEACDKKGIKVNTENGIYESNTEEDKTSKEERLASLKTQLEQDGDQLSDDEKEAIQAEINELENEEPSMNESVTIAEIEEITQRIESAQDMDEIQQIIYTISDGVLEDIVQNMFDSCNENDDLDEVKSLILTTLEDNAEYDEEDSLTEASTPNVEKFIYDLDVDSGNAWSVNYNDRKRGVEVYKNGKSEKTVDDIIKAVTSKYPQLKVSMKGKNTVLFKYDDKDKSLKEDETPEAMQAIADKQMPKGGYRYMARHAIGPGTLPDDIKVFKTEDTDDGKIAMYISRPLTSEELKKYDIDPEWIQESAVPKLADYQNAFNDDFNKIYNIGTYEDGMGDLDIYKNNKRVGSIYRNDDNKYEVTLRKHFKEKVADTWQDAVKLLNDVASEEVSAQDLTEETTMKRYKVSFYVDTDTMNNMDIEEKVAEILAGSGLASTDETIDVENITDLTEADNITETKVSDLKNIKSQGNIYMLQDNKRFIVGENYDEAQGLIENAEIYDNKDDADKDYLDRCDITKDGKKVQLNGQDDINEE